MRESHAQEIGGSDVNLRYSARKNSYKQPKAKGQGLLLLLLLLLAAAVAVLSFQTFSTAKKN